MKITKAMLDIGSLEADAKNTHDNYEYISADKILERVGKVFGENDIAVIPSANDVRISEHAYMSGGQQKTMFAATVKMSMYIIDGEHKLEAPWIGCGVDYRVPDKAVYKAITSGHKYFLTKLLMIGVGNEDGDHQPGSSVGRGTEKNKDEDKEEEIQRPYPPEMVKERIGEKSLHYSQKGETASNELRGAVVGWMNNIWKTDDKDGNEERRRLIKSIFGVDSSKKLTDAHVLALRDWMQPIEDNFPSPLAIAEAKKILRQKEN